MQITSNSSMNYYEAPLAY